VRLALVLLPPGLLARVFEVRAELGAGLAGIGELSGEGLGFFDFGGELLFLYYQL
jgi:hypothetical protein